MNQTEYNKTKGFINEPFSATYGCNFFVIYKKKAITYCHKCNIFPRCLECLQFIAVCEQSKAAKSNYWFTHTKDMYEYLLWSLIISFVEIIIKFITLYL